MHTFLNLSCVIGGPPSTVAVRTHFLNTTNVLNTKASWVELWALNDSANARLDTIIARDVVKEMLCAPSGASY